jgi:hypothetical protein
VANCKYCSANSGATCSTCLSTFFLDTNTCKSCGTGCSTCTSSTSCSVCSSKYYLDSTKSCKPCPQGCATCTSATHCSSCISFWVKDGNLCREKTFFEKVMTVLPWMLICYCIIGVCVFAKKRQFMNRMSR